MYTNPITLRPQQDMPYDLRPRALQWDEVMDSDSTCALSPSISSAVRFPAAHMTAPQELFVLSPQATAYLGSNQDSPGELGGGGYPDVNATSNPNRRQSQNREAQRRFRERREQERIQLRKRMEELRAENDALSRLLAEAKNANLKLEVDNERLTKELETLRRRWQDVLRLMADMVQQEEVGEGGSPSSCSSSSSLSSSSSSSRKEVQGLRSSIMMQMLVLLFDEKGDSPSRTVMARLGALSGDP
ncbi:putative bZIP transcription factor [Aspergillus fischeri NRRL 181]|uniref:BZIP transcription factor, putative n=1 Tax=Neosartorya fischeri (strain ATCC 1020 / DSM 3700 / CBS 544.65 / FGSC A1164 / JCM 1740 / NRRL 181 / WB 181) TaxID=331117 RepID=A1DEH6_NEOFI|nr:bZIP transcription factor, putative [Aspergillus fischeri NRRL 181]EAW17783.1 bZIP transcription factor, putative [Aspergillus fischeri NRRL 181]